MAVPQLPAEPPKVGVPPGESTVIGSGLIPPEPARDVTPDQEPIDPEPARSRADRRPVLLLGIAAAILVAAGVTFALTRSGDESDVTDDPADQAVQVTDPDDVIRPLPRPPRDIEVNVAGDELRVTWDGQVGPTISYELRHGAAEPVMVDDTEAVLPREDSASDCVELRTFDSGRISSWSDPVCAAGG